MGSEMCIRDRAIPHARIEGIDDAKIIILKLNQAIDFNSTDNIKVDIIISLLVPKDSNDVHIKLLSNIATLLNKEVFRDQLRQANIASDVIKIIQNTK